MGRSKAQDMVGPPVGRMQALVTKERVNAIGGTAGLQQAIGFTAIGALSDSSTTWEGAASIATVFEGPTRFELSSQDVHGTGERAGIPGTADATGSNEHMFVALAMEIKELGQPIPPPAKRQTEAIVERGSSRRSRAERTA